MVRRRGDSGPHRSFGDDVGFHSGRVNGCGATWSRKGKHFLRLSLGLETSDGVRGPDVSPTGVHYLCRVLSCPTLLFKRRY